MDAANDFARLITAARGDLPMRELARRSGLSVAQISRIEAGSVETPTLETVSSLAEALERDPQLLAVALGRVRDEESVSVVLRTSVRFGSSGGRGERDIRAVEQAHERVQELDKRRLMYLDGLQTSAGKEEMLKAEATELEHEIETLPPFEALNDEDPDSIAMREMKNKLVKRLMKVLLEVDAIAQRGAELRRQVTKCEKAMEKALERRRILVRQAAGNLFESGARSPDPFLGPLAEDAISTNPHFERGAAEMAAKIKAAAMAAHEARAQTRAELDRLTRQVRNQLVHHTDDPDFRKLAAAWSRLTADRRERVLDFVEDQRRLSVQEQVAREEVEAIGDGSARASSKKRH